MLRGKRENDSKTKKQDIVSGNGMQEIGGYSTGLLMLLV